MAPMSDFFKRNPLTGLWGGGNSDGEVFYIVHPLDDEPEEKCDPEALGPLKLSRAERVVLFALQGYLLVMVGMAAYRVADLAGLFGHTAMH